jgi:xanthine dehydrogenase molybdenum-binding subunit
MDMLAKAAGMDPVEFRQINANHGGDVSLQNHRITTCGLESCIRKVETQLEMKREKEKGEGVGIASLIHVGGGARVYKSDGCGTIIKVDDFGKVSVFTGATDMGQGSDTVIAQIVAEELGISIKDIHVIHSDTDVCPWDVGAHASRSTFVAGNSALGAAKKIKTKILEIASGMLDVSPDRLVFRNKSIMDEADPEKIVDIGKLLRKAHFSKQGQMLMAEYFYDPANENLGRDFKGNISMTYTFGSHGARVKVDEETGKVQILQYVAAHDVGKAINPLLLEGQVYGGVMMGIGYALTEQVILEKGECMNPNFRDYKILTAKDVVPIQAPILETFDKDGPYGAKGIGEPGCVPTAPAIANAIYDAIGVRIKDLPITPERVLAAIREKKGLDPCGYEINAEHQNTCE